MRSWIDKHKARGLSYTLIGTGMTPVSWVILYGLISGFGWKAIPAYLLQGVVTIVAAYCLQRKYTWQEDEHHWRRNLPKWAVVRTLHLVAGASLFAGLSLGLPFLPAIMLTGISLWLPFYLFTHHWVFGNPAIIEGAEAKV